MPNLPSDIETFLTDLLDHADDAPLTFRPSLVHPEMQKFLDRFGLDQERLQDMLDDETNTMLSGLVVDDLEGDMSYLVSPLEAELVRTMAIRMLMTVEAMDGVGAVIVRHEDTPEDDTVGLPLRTLYLLFAAFGSLMFASKHYIAPAFERSAANVPMLTMIMSEAIREALDTRDDSALQLALAVYDGAMSGDVEDLDAPEATPFE